MGIGDGNPFSLLYLQIDTMYNDWMAAKGSWETDDPMDGAYVNFGAWDLISPANNGPSTWIMIKAVNQCASRTAPSLASMFGWNQDNFWVSAFAGNDASTLSNLVFGPGRSGAAASLAVTNPTKYSLVNLGASAAGKIPTGGVIYVSSGMAVATPYGTAIQMVPTLQTVDGVAGKVAGKVAGVLTAGKALFDAGTYIGALVACTQ